MTLDTAGISKVFKDISVIENPLVSCRYDTELVDHPSLVTALH